MHTIGEILKKARLEKKIPYEDVEKRIRIRTKFLIALENNDWDKLPALPYIKGFIRNYSAFLGLKPEEMVAIFRRQYNDQPRAKLLPESVNVTSPILRLTPQSIVTIGIVAFLLILFGSLFFQYKASTNPPMLQIDNPAEGFISASDTISVTGKTDPDAVVSVNNQKIAGGESGKFQTTVSLSPGVNTITIESVSKYGKKQTMTRTVQFQQSQ